MAPFAAIGLLQLLGWLVGVAIFGIIPVVCFWRILAKAGFCNPRWSLLAFIPGAQIILLIVLAAAEW
jgi:hypothetical protein